MAVNIVTGMTGVAHITSDDDRAKNASIFGKGKYVLDYGKKFEATILSNNQIRVRDGMCINQGTQMGIEPSDYEDVTIENGVSGSNRNDLIVMRYERNADTSIENASLVVIKGTPGSTATDPSYNSGNILDGGDLIDDMPLFRVKIESLTITAVEPLFNVFNYIHRKALAGLLNVDNTSDLNKPLSIATQKAIDELNTGIQSVDSKLTTNLLKPTLATTTQNGVTCTNNGDGTYTLNGTASANTSFYFISSKNALGLSNFVGKKLKLLGNPVIGDENCRLLAVNESLGADATDVGNGSVFTLAETTKMLYIDIKSGFVFDNLVFKLMLTTNLNATYDDFVPYTGDTGSLNSDVAYIVEDLEEAQLDIQAVDKKVTTNLLKPTLATTTRNGITFTNNGDGTYTLNGTATSLFADTFGYYSIDEGKPYKLLCCPSGGSLSTYYADWRNDSDGQIFEFGDGSVYTSKTGQSNKAVRVIVNKGFTCDNLVFKPMLTTNLNATYDDFVPYTGSTGQINSDVASIKAQVREYSLGSACEKGVSTSIVSGDENLVTGDAVSKAIFTATNYEEGTFTPKFWNGANKEETPTYLSAQYKNFGSLCYIRINATGSNLSVSKIDGLPFSPNTNVYPYDREGTYSGFVLGYKSDGSFKPCTINGKEAHGMIVLNDTVTKNVYVEGFYQI